MLESLFPHLRLDSLLNATWETLYMTGIAGLATLVLGIVLGVLLFLTSRGQLLQTGPSIR
jgi:D-methionine transport system permease protein